MHPSKLFKGKPFVFVVFIVDFSLMVGPPKGKRGGGLGLGGVAQNLMGTPQNASPYAGGPSQKIWRRLVQPLRSFRDPYTHTYIHP